MIVDAVHHLHKYIHRNGLYCDPIEYTLFWLYNVHIQLYFNLIQVNRYKPQYRGRITHSKTYVICPQKFGRY